ncbi:hypothetical protein XANCAGTX0491_006935 [Xanthoria calcicola]
MASPKTANTTITALKDYATNWSGTDTIDLGTSTGGSNVLGSSTDVSLYTVSPTAATSTTGATTSTISPSGTTAGQASMTGSAASTGSSWGAEVVASARILGSVVAEVGSRNLSEESGRSRWVYWLENMVQGSAYSVNA